MSYIQICEMAVCGIVAVAAVFWVGRAFGARRYYKIKQEMKDLELAFKNLTDDMEMVSVVKMRELEDCIEKLAELLTIADKKCLYLTDLLDETDGVSDRLRVYKMGVNAGSQSELIEYKSSKDIRDNFAKILNETAMLAKRIKALEDALPSVKDKIDEYVKKQTKPYIQPLAQGAAPQSMRLSEPQKPSQASQLLPLPKSRQSQLASPTRRFEDRDAEWRKEIFLANTEEGFNESAAEAQTRFISAEEGFNESAAEAKARFTIAEEGFNESAAKAKARFISAEEGFNGAAKTQARFINAEEGFNEGTAKAQARFTIAEEGFNGAAEAKARFINAEEGFNGAAEAAKKTLGAQDLNETESKPFAPSNPLSVGLANALGPIKQQWAQKKGSSCAAMPVGEILRQYRKGTGVPQIAKNMGMSIIEIEMILRLYHLKNSEDKNVNAS